METVLKPFTTVNRRFAAGMTVGPDDVPDFADKQARGFISGAPDPDVVSVVEDEFEAPAARARKR